MVIVGRAWTETDGPRSAYASNGAPYVILTSGGIKDEGALAPFVILAQPWGIEAAERAAWMLFEKELVSFLDKARASKVEWRVRPEIEQFGNWDGTVAIRVYARLAVVESHPEEAIAA